MMKYIESIDIRQVVVLWISSLHPDWLVESPRIDDALKLDVSTLTLIQQHLSNLKKMWF